MAQQGLSHLHPLVIFIAAFLLFQVQPLIGKSILPWFGGSPTVWTTCMLFFQFLLLAGYSYGHLIISGLKPSWQRIVHLSSLIVSLAVLSSQLLAWSSPLIPGASWRPTGGSPSGQIIVLLAVTIGLPYFVLSSTTPLLQGWFLHTQQGVMPYRLYAVSNLGSLLAVASYPIVIEPLLSLRSQAIAWILGYYCFVLGCGYCTLKPHESGPSLLKPADAQKAIAPPEARARPRLAQYLMWMSLSGCASLLLLAATNQMCQEVAVIPLLWMLPLGLYLLTLILCFEKESRYSRHWFVDFSIGAALTCVVLFRGSKASILDQIAVYSFVLFASCMVCHGELVRIRPDAQYLTSYYLAIAAGAAVGSSFAALIAPIVFKGYWEFHLGLVLCSLLAVVVLLRDERSWVHRGNLLLRLGAISAAVVVLAGSLFWQANGSKRGAIEVTRNFFGVLTVKEESAYDPNWDANVLVHGQTVHGLQYLQKPQRSAPTTYFGPNSGVGLALLNHPRRSSAMDDQRSLRIGAIGLGVGTIAAYGKPGDYLRFYEINPDVIRFAEGRGGYFTYLKDSQASVEVALGDARVNLEQEFELKGSQEFDVLVVDAFNSNAIPVHLLTQEAFALYLKHLRRPEGILAFHISNRSLDLRPVVWALADHFGLETAMVIEDESPHVVYANTWILATHLKGLFSLSPFAKASTPRKPNGHKGRLWTDDYTNLLAVLKVLIRAREFLYSLLHHTL